MANDNAILRFKDLKYYDKKIKNILDEDYTLTAGAGIEISEDNVIGLNGENISNPNLLVNPDFKINQRGLTEYTNGYSVDRWRIGSALKLNILDNGIQLTKYGSGTHVFEQRIDVSNLKGETLTCSIYVESHTGSSKITVGYDGSSENIVKTYINNIGINTISFVVPEDADTIVFQPAIPESLETITVLKWCKVEIGSIATAFIPPNTTSELLKCGSPDDTSTYGYLPIGIGSNPNLLVNPDFKINQRGKTEYTEEGYTVDRWHIEGGEKLTITDDGVTIECIATAGRVFLQSIDIPEYMVGVPMTLSVNVLELSGRVYTTVNDIDNIITNTGIVTYHFTPTTTKLTIQPARPVDVGAYAAIAWAKLEFGLMATAFIPPNPAEELLKIQSTNDDGTPKLITNDTLPVIMNSQMVSNPNLLVNPDFSINQRGQTEYVNAGSLEVYSFDMWTIIGTVRKTEDNVIISPENSPYGYGRFLQHIPYDYTGVQLALSAKINGEIKSVTGVCSGELVEITNSTNDWRLRFVVINSETIVEIIANEETTVKWAKLELGSVATPFVPPDPATELLKIQSMNDDGTTKLVSNDTLPVIMNSQMVSNPNLLVNPDFSINQRGQEEYTGKAAYTVDHWRLHAGERTIFNVANKAIIIPQDDSKDWYGILQYIEYDLTGKTITVSADIETDVDIYLRFTYGSSTSATVAKLITAGYSGIVTMTCDIPNDIADTSKFGVQLTNKNAPTAGGTCKVNWMKVEFGSIATPFIPPDPATELVKCQRCYEVLMDEFVDRNIIGAVNPTNRKAIFDIPFKVTKRVAPSLASGKVRLIVSDNSTNTIVFNEVVDVTIFQADKNGMAVTAIIPDTVTLTNTCNVSIDTRAVDIPAFAVSADI